tara:strand:- start:5431 stop:7581 length:2151 start_codon:yes stop_codon:yes gene_type:complete
MVIVLNKILLFIFTFLIIGDSFKKNTILKNNNSFKSYEKYNVIIYRDTWGVPHIFGDKDEDTAYGLGYAHAEDDFATIQDILIAARGNLAKYYGRSVAANDYMVKLLKIWDTVEKNYENGLSDDVIKISEAYADGINHYASLYPDKAFKGVFPVKGKDIVAGFIHRMPLMFGLDGTLAKLATNKYPIKNEDPSTSESDILNQRMLGSNVIAVSPSRSDDKFTRILINSHQPWSGPVAWYEAHLNSNEGWNMVGGLFPGSPVVLVGHNENIGWSHTVNKPDLIDVYELTLNPENSNQYYFDGRYENFEISESSIKVKIWGPIKWTFKRKVFRSKHGPVIKNEHGSFAIRYSGHDEFRYLEQWFRMNKSQNFDDFENALKLMAIPMFNTIYADKEGNIFYIYNALFPKRSDGYIWEGDPLKGDTSENLWKDYLPYKDLPKILNPKSGFLQNCNSSPFLATTGNDNPDQSLYNNNLGIERFQTNRALRAHEVYGEDLSIDRSEFYNYKYDTKYSEKSVLVTNLKRFLAEAKTKDKNANQAINILSKWNYETDSLAVGVHYALDAIKPVYNPDDYYYDYELIMQRLKTSVNKTKDHFGKLDIKWGDIQRLKRGNKNLALSGGPDILRAIYTKGDKGQRKAVAGDCYFQIVEWSPKGEVSSQSIHQYGSATLDSNSPYYNDQSQLFSTNKMKPVWMSLKDIKLNLLKSYSPGGEKGIKEKL